MELNKISNALKRLYEFVRVHVAYQNYHRTAAHFYGFVGQAHASSAAGQIRWRESSMRSIRIVLSR